MWTAISAALSVIMNLLDMFQKRKLEDSIRQEITVESRKEYLRAKEDALETRYAHVPTDKRNILGRM